MYSPTAHRRFDQKESHLFGIQCSSASVKPEPEPPASTKILNPDSRELHQGCGTSPRDKTDETVAVEMPKTKSLVEGIYLLSLATPARGAGCILLSGCVVL